MRQTLPLAGGAALLLAAALTGCVSRDKALPLEANAREEQRSALLGKHSFHRDRFDAGMLGLLAGNGEMGGLVALDGLGFDSIWCADLWEDRANRVPLEGLRVQLGDARLESGKIERYSQSQSLRDGTVVTEVQYAQGAGYRSRVFLSANDRRLLAIQVENLNADEPLIGQIRVPEANYKYLTDWPTYEMGAASESRFAIERVGESALVGRGSPALYTRGAWSLRSTGALRKTPVSNRFGVEIAPGGEQTFLFAFVTHWQTEEYAQASARLTGESADYRTAERHHQEAWDGDWARTALLVLPDQRHEQLFYRSVFWLFSTAGHGGFLPGESQFATPCWNMRPFTYGAAGWATLAFTRLGHFERARTMLEAHFKPAALSANAHPYIQAPSGKGGAFSFAHEVRTDGTTNGVNDEQRHLNGFALALFHQYYVMTGDEEFLRNSLYPVARGVAEFWSGLAVRNPSVEAYTFPKLRSVSEDLVEESILDVVLSARWSLETAVHYSEQLRADQDARQRWAKVARELHVPQNDRHYLEFLGDREDREYGSYQGIRAPVYLGYPTSELASRLDSEKARRTLEHAWERNARGKGMLGFIASWYALAAQRYGLGDLALEMAERNFDCYERSGTALCEGPNNLDRYYFLTTTAAYLLVPIHMLVQEREGQIVPFPAVPESWQEVAFHRVPTAGGRRVSGVRTKGVAGKVGIEED